MPIDTEQAKMSFMKLYESLHYRKQRLELADAGEQSAAHSPVPKCARSCLQPYLFPVQTRRKESTGAKNPQNIAQYLEISRLTGARTPASRQLMGLAFSLHTTGSYSYSSGDSGLRRRLHRPLLFFASGGRLDALKPEAILFHCRLSPRNTNGNEQGTGNARSLARPGEERTMTPTATSSSFAVPASQNVLRRILIAEDSEIAQLQLQKVIEGSLDVQVDVVSDGTQALAALLEHSYSIVLTDLQMPGVNGMELIEELHKRSMSVTVIVTTGHGSIDTAVQAMQFGAFDFLTKPIDVQHLLLVIQRALEQRRLQDEIASLREQLRGRHAFHDVVSKNPRMHAVFELINNIAATTSTVLIEGETGTGKEVVARAIHAAANGRRGPLVAVNCAALPETLLESELFGHEKGAFTSAVGQRKGRFEMANGGTLFLDEVGDIPATMQAKLLRVLQERQFERVGGTQPIKVDVRVIAATNRSLRQLVAAGKFREDLYYRLNVVKIDLPALRERTEDIPLLATHFAKKYARPDESPRQIAPECMEVLLHYAWPGNIRQLENAIERACVTSHGTLLRAESLPPEVAGPATKKTGRIDWSRPLSDLLDEQSAKLESRYLRKALKRARGNLSRCARRCSLSRQGLVSKLSQYQIDAGPGQTQGIAWPTAPCGQ
jgi:DNA-binding NtrC family response regulator